MVLGHGVGEDEGHGGLRQVAAVGDSPVFLLVSLGVEPPAGIEPATPSLPWNHQEPMCEPPFPQVPLDRKGRRYRFSSGHVVRSMPGTDRH